MKVTSRDGTVIFEPKHTFKTIFKEERIRIKQPINPDYPNFKLGEILHMDNENKEQDLLKVLEGLYKASSNLLADLKRYNNITLELMDIYKKELNYANAGDTYLMQIMNKLDDVNLNRHLTVEVSQNFSILIKELSEKKLDLKDLSRPSKEAIIEYFDDVLNKDYVCQVIYEYIDKCEKPYIGVLVSANVRLEKYLRMIESILSDMDDNNRTLALYRFDLVD